MADIKIEKKKNNNTPIWPWILGLLLVAGIIWAIASMDSDPEPASNEVAVVEEPYNEPVVTEPQSNVVNAENEDFVSYVNQKDVQEQMGIDHQVTSQALTKLANSLSELSQNDDQYSQQINEVKQTADEIQRDPQSLQHANKVNSAFSSAANVMDQIQQDRFPDAESSVNDVQDAADKIKNDEQLLNQKEEVDTFFEKAADAVEEMKGNSSM